LEKHSAEEVFPIILGFNTFIYDNLSYGLEMHRPKTTDVFDEEVTDYRGITKKVKSHESVALYKAGRWFGELSREVNLSSIKYVKSKYNRSIDTREKLLSYEKGKPLLYIDGKEVDI
jgi:hypothetical protein